MPGFEQEDALSRLFIFLRHGFGMVLKEKLNITGTRHITAVSGMHIPITL